MQELTLGTLIAVFEEMFGTGLWWLMVAVAAGLTLLFFYIMFRDKRFKPQHYLLAQLTSPFGAIAAVWFVMWKTSSSFNDIGGPIDVIVLMAIAAVGAGGTVILAYEVQSIWARRQASSRGSDQG